MLKASAPSNNIRLDSYPAASRNGFPSKLPARLPVIRQGVACVVNTAVKEGHYCDRKRVGRFLHLSSTSNGAMLTCKKDLDSFTSSVLYAYFRSLHPPKDAFTPLYIPLLNIPASDISLRPEFLKLFHYANISLSHIITLDDLPLASNLSKELPPANTRWILVDHNRLQGIQGSLYADRVHGVIDHHEEENAVPEDTAPEPRVVEKIGSCSSLVIRTFKSTWDTVASTSLSSGAAHAQSSDSTIDDSVVTQGWDAQIAKLALGSILEDTSNLKSESKTTSVDREAVEVRIFVALIGRFLLVCGL